MLLCPQSEPLRTANPETQTLNPNPLNLPPQPPQHLIWPRAYRVWLQGLQGVLSLSSVFGLQGHVPTRTQPQTQALKPKTFKPINSENPEPPNPNPQIPKAPKSLMLQNPKAQNHELHMRHPLMGSTLLRKDTGASRWCLCMRV